MSLPPVRRHGDTQGPRATNIDTLRASDGSGKGRDVPVYYHETIDPTSVREKEVEYLATLGDVVTKIVNTPRSQMRCLANWVVIWAPGRWQQFVGQWEMASCEWFTTHFENFKLEVDHPKGYEEYRHGGFDRLLVSAGGTPTPAEIVARGAPRRGRPG